MAGNSSNTLHSASIATPVSSPAFAAAAGYRIAVMVQGGVETAQLQLNPAGMGPVRVQIAVDGQNAQVHLAAELSDTRQALEAALPQLASQLRDAGFTLTGGGVFEQPARPQQPAPDSGGNPGLNNGASSSNGSSNGNHSGISSGNSSGNSSDNPGDRSRLPATQGGAEGRGAGRDGGAWQPRGLVDLVA